MECSRNVVFVAPKIQRDPLNVMPFFFLVRERCEVWTWSFILEGMTRNSPPWTPPTFLVCACMTKASVNPRSLLFTSYHVHILVNRYILGGCMRWSRSQKTNSGPISAGRHTPTARDCEGTLVSTRWKLWLFSAYGERNIQQVLMPFCYDGDEML